MSAIDLSSTVGLAALVLLTLNILLGLLVSVNYNTVKRWPRRRLPVPLYRLHNWNAYVAISVALLHPAILLCSKTAGFRIQNVLWPLDSPGQTTYNVLGAVTLYGFTLVVVTSYLRRRLGHVAWKRLHYVAYLAAACMFVHGAWIDQNLKNQPPDFLDGEKLIVETCFFAVLSGSIWRWRYGSEKVRFQRARRFSQG
jgi:DMSO/TMAO reductase YedYZ heme-binding membrane subunit